MNIYTVTILISILAYVAVGNYAGRKVKNLEDYFVVGRQAPTLLIVGTLVARILSNLTPLSYTQALFLAWLSYTSFTLYSGSRGVAFCRRWWCADVLGCLPEIFSKPTWR